MDSNTVKQIIKTKPIRVLFRLSILYFIGFLIFLVWVEPSRPQGNYFVGISDVIYLLYWRWYLDWVIIGMFLLCFIILTAFMLFLKRRLHVDIEKLKTYGFPIGIMVINYVGMVAIDVAITYFADVWINGTWESTDAIFLGLTAQQTYHGFFFWFMPALLVIGLPVYRVISEPEHPIYYGVKTLFVYIGGFSITLGLLDPLVCQFIWDDWSIFGNWNMMGWGWIWATGWISHYMIFGGLWFWGAKLVDKTFHQLTNSQSTSD